MEIKEWGVGALFVGGAAYGIAQYGLNDVLSEDLKHITEVTLEQRPAYMDQVVAEFTEAFATYGVQTETYMYEGFSNFTTSPRDGAFVEVVRQDSPVPQKEISGIRAVLEEADFCQQDEMTMFTENGWTYRFFMEDSQGRRVYSVVCLPAATTPKLRGMS